MNKSVIERATSHFRGQLSGAMGKIHVSEWDCDVYYRAANTLKDESRLIELAREGKTVEALVETLIMKARNEDGSRMFTLGDKATFMNEVDPQVLIRIVGEMNSAAASVSSVEEAAKN
jgi:hypothetical protein